MNGNGNTNTFNEGNVRTTIAAIMPTAFKDPVYFYSIVFSSA